MEEGHLLKMIHQKGSDTHNKNFLFINDTRGGLSYKPGHGGFVRSPRHDLDLSFEFFLLLLREINDDDDDDDDDKNKR